MTFLVASTLRISVLLAIAFVTASALRRNSAAIRHLIWSVGVLAALAVPIAIWMVPARRIEIPLPKYVQLPGLEIPVSSPANVGAAARSTVSDVKTRSKDSSTPATAPPQALPKSASSLPPRAPHTPTVPATSTHIAPDVLVLILALWLMGILFMLTSMIVGIVRVKMFALKSVQIHEGVWYDILNETARRYGLRRPIRLLRARDHSLLMTYGVWRPVLFIPSDSESWPKDRICVAVCHELAHIRRRDWPIQIAAELLRAIYWFNPLTWVACRSLVQESEQACDDVAMGNGIVFSEYARHLLELTKILSAPLDLPTAVPMAHPSTLERRFAAILNSDEVRRPANRVSVASTAIIFLILTLGITIVRVATGAQKSAAISAVTTAVTAPAEILSSIQSLVATIAPVPNPEPQITFQNSSMTVEGTVFELGTNAPVSDVDVEMTRVEGTSSAPLAPLVFPSGGASPGARGLANMPNPSEEFRIRTTQTGRFEFTGLKPGTYRLLAARGGGTYLPAEFGQHDPRGTGYNFVLTDGQSMKSIRLEMARTGSISGHVTDASGKPAVRARVMVLNRTHQLQRSGFSIVQAVYTDDKGDYRMFWLPPGRYSVAARLDDDPRRRSLSLFVTPPLADTSGGWETFTQAAVTMRGLSDGSIVEETYDLVYFGGDTNPQNAKMIDVHSGSNEGGIDISLAAGKMRARHIRGILTVGSDSMGLANASITANPVNPGPSIVAPRTVSKWDGSFDISGLGTGAYVLYGSISPDNKLLSGVVTIPPGEANIDGVKLVVSSGFEIDGHVTIEGATGTADPSTILVSASPAGGQASRSNKISSANGSFSISGLLPGDFRISVGWPGTDFYVKSIRLGSVDALSDRVSIPGPSQGELDVVVRMNAGKLEGTVVNGSRQAVINGIAVLIPESSQRKRRDLYKTSITDLSGRFKFQGIAPGDYTVIAADYLEDGIWTEPEFLRVVESRGVTVHVQEGSNSDIQVERISSLP